MNDEGLYFNIGLFGKVDVGKSIIAVKYITNHFIEYQDPCIEDEYRRLNELNDQKLYTSILDTAYPRDIYDPFQRWVEYSQVFVLIYSIIDKSSFQEILEIHEKILHFLNVQDYPKILIGNKSDLFTKREVKTKQGKELAKQLNCKYIETSAKTGENIHQLFYEASILAFEEMKKNPNKFKNQNKKKKGKCLLM
ncbi:small g-protein ras2 [Anaeramoeba ignava]|uniref:Small g-protein ras2 n=1 Tax=Anaeramoeba ignava TaxID=1746090 RepID=A0A9Q0LC71_ANAIG|nr:small g-protein ras2 [Anaeramoeba ignava]